MEKYESLEKLYYKKENIETEYNLRINNPQVHITNLKIHPYHKNKKAKEIEYLLFYNNIKKIDEYQNKILTNSKKLKKLVAQLPVVAHMACVDDLIVSEVISTNKIEGLYIEKKDVYEMLRLKNIAEKLGIVHKYHQIIIDKIDKIDSVEKIREIYNDIFPDDSLKNLDKKLDGKFFRKEKICISNGIEIVHTGDSSEELIIKHMEGLLDFINKSDVPSLIKFSIFHYYFEYIHPFYDGNGRVGRFLISLFLAREIDIFTGLSFSYAVNIKKQKYWKLFKDTSKLKNKGEATFFILGMLEFIIDGQESIYKILKEKKLKLNNVEKIVDKIEKRMQLELIEGDILFIYIQNYIFAEERALPDKDMKNYLQTEKSIRTIRRHLNKLIDLGLLKFVRKKPIVRTITDEVKNMVKEI